LSAVSNVAVDSNSVGKQRGCNITGCLQPTLFEVEPGVILALTRTGCGIIGSTISNLFAFATACALSFIPRGQAPTTVKHFLHTVPSPVCRTPMQVSELMMMLSCHFFRQSSIDPGICGVNMKQSSAGLILLYNDSTNQRCPLSLAQSPNGKEWSKTMDVQADCSTGISYQYPTVIQDRVSIRCSKSMAFTDLQPKKV